MSAQILPRHVGGSLVDWTLRFLADAEIRRNERELYRRIDQCREIDANTYVIEG
jgi:hypothetical protein